MPDFIVRTTTEGDLSFTVMVPREVPFGAPVHVVVGLVNRGVRPVLLTFSDPVRFLKPGVWVSTASKMPLTQAGQRALGNREETSNRTYEVAPGKPWSFEFDVTDYYQLTVPHSYRLTLGCAVERINPDTGDRSLTQFDVGGIRFNYLEKK